MNGQKRKKNHWVPQAYLRYFAADDVGRKIWTFSKLEGDPELRPIQKVAVRYYLYAPQSRNGARDYSFEEQLGDLEQWLGSPLWRAAATDFVDLSDTTLRKMLALTMAVTYLRNPSHLDFLHTLHHGIRDLIESSGSLPTHFKHRGQDYEVDQSSWPEYRDATIEEIKRNWISTMRSATWLAEIFLKMRWAMVIADEPTFITSDNPVTPIHSDVRFRGFKNKGTSVMFPLSPTRLLCLDHLLAEPDAQYYTVRGRGEAQNLLLWRNAIDKMFSARNIDQVLTDLANEAERQGF